MEVEAVASFVSAVVVDGVVIVVVSSSSSSSSFEAAPDAFEHSAFARDALGLEESSCLIGPEQPRVARELLLVRPVGEERDLLMFLKFLIFLRVFSFGFFFLFRPRNQKTKRTTALLLGSLTATTTERAFTATSSWTTSIAELPDFVDFVFLFWSLKKVRKEILLEKKEKHFPRKLHSPNPTTSTLLPANLAHDPSLAFSCDECSTSPRKPFLLASCANAGILGLL